jgi:hypothetical protein
MDARDIANSVLLAGNTGMYHPRAVLIDPIMPMPYEQLPPMAQPPVYPEINPTYPGPFLRDPAELNTDDEWRTRV